MACRVFISEDGLAVNTTKIAANANNSHEPNKAQTYEDNVDIKPVIEDDTSHDLSSVVNDNSDKELSDCQKQTINDTDEVSFSAHVNTMDDNEAAISTCDEKETALPDHDTMYTEMSAAEPIETEADTSIPMERDSELKVSDVLEQAIQIGEGIEDINTNYGESATGAIMPKLIFMLGKLEGLVAQHHENKSTIKALLLEQEDLKVQQEKSEKENKKLTEKLEEAENDVKYGERQLQVQVRLLKLENKSLSKDLKKKTKKLRRKQSSSGQNTLLWLLDRIFFGGRIFFVTKELPRDVTAIRKLNTEIHTQRQEISRLTNAIDIQEKENEEKKGTNIQLQIKNKHLELEVSSIEKRLSEIEVESDDETDTYPGAKQKNYKLVMVEGLKTKSLSDEIKEKSEKSEQIERCDTNSTDNRVLITDSVDDLCYWDITTNNTNTAAENIFEPSCFSHHDEEMTTPIVGIDNQIFEADTSTCELGGQGVLLTQTNNSNNNNNYNDEIKTNGYDSQKHEDSFDIENIKYEVKVDIHSNRKDYKKLLLAQEVRDSITTIKAQNNLEPNYGELYDHSNSDTKSDSADENTCYHWDEVDSKTSYEDVSCVTSSDEKLHMYFILDKKNMSAKKVEPDEYRAFLEKSISLPKISNSFDSDENLNKIDTTYNNITSLTTIGQNREENAIISF